MPVLIAWSPAKTDPPDLTAALDVALQRSFAQSGAPGVVAAVQTPEFTWIRALGVGDKTTGQPMTAVMHTRIASVTKIFTITLLLQAADEGLLSLDDPMGRYYPNIPNGDQITLRLLAIHRSGFADYLDNQQFVAQWKADPKRVWRPDELVTYGIEGSPQFPPGRDFHYSNTNTVLLGLVLQQATGQTGRSALKGDPPYHRAVHVHLDLADALQIHPPLRRQPASAVSVFGPLHTVEPRLALKSRIPRLDAGPGRLDPPEEPSERLVQPAQRGLLA
jgi:hypothetical protein